MQHGFIKQRRVSQSHESCLKGSRSRQEYSDWPKSGLQKIKSLKNVKTIYKNLENSMLSSQIPKYYKIIPI